MAEPLFLGLDLSTQQLKAILITASSNIVRETAVHFDNDLPQYNTTNGALHGDATSTREGVVAAPVAMWLDALDLLLEKMKNAGVNFSLIRAIGGSAQVSDSNREMYP
jgi:xylulokinase